VHQLYVDFKSAWFGLANSTEQYILRYESKYLREMGQVLEYLVSIGVTTAVQETLKHTVLSSMYLSLFLSLSLFCIVIGVMMMLCIL